MAGRGSTTQRGYGTPHQRLRARTQGEVDRGEAYCWRCLAEGKSHEQAWIAPGSDWDLGHDDHDRNVYRGPEHRACNRRTRARQDRPVRTRAAGQHPGILRG